MSFIVTTQALDLDPLILKTLQVVSTKTKAAPNRELLVWLDRSHH